MNALRQLLGSSAFSDLDRHFAAFIEQQDGGDRPRLALAAALVSRQRGEGHICLDLEGVAGTTCPEEPTDGVTPVHLPRLKDWLRELKASPVVGTPVEESGPDYAKISSNLALFEFRNNSQRRFYPLQTFPAHCEHHLQRTADGWKIKLKKVVLLNCDGEIFDLTFLL